MLVWSLSNKWVLFWTLGASADTLISIKVLGAPGGKNPILGDFGLCFFFKLSVLIPQTPKCDLVYFDFYSTFSLLKYWPFFSRALKFQAMLFSQEQKLLWAMPGLHLSFVMGQIQHTNKDKMIFHFTLWSEIQPYMGQGSSDRVFVLCVCVFLWLDLYL